MAARTRRGTSHEGWAQSVRERIKTSMILNRLQDHTLGKCDLSNTQVRAAEILLRKTMPDLSQVESNSTVEHRYVARVPEKAATVEQWQQQHPADQPTQH